MSKELKNGIKILVVFKLWIKTVKKKCFDQ